MKPHLTEADFAALREAVRPYLKKRIDHVLGVEEEVVRLGEIFLPEKIPSLRCAALLHDLTKKMPAGEQLKVISEYGILVDDSLRFLPKTLHAVTGAVLAPVLFPDYCDDEVVSGIRWHTTGRESMTLFESLVYLADYTEKNRRFESCVLLRNYFWNGFGEGMTQEERLLHLDRTMILSFDLTLRDLVASGEWIAEDTVRARNWFLSRVRAEEKNSKGGTP